MAKQHIKWTDEEWDLLARCMANYLTDNPGSTLPSAYNAVSHNLKDRVRIMNSAKSFDPIIDRIRELMRKNKKGTKEDKKEEPKIKVIDRHIKSNITDFTTDQLQSELFRRSFEPMLKEMVENLSHKVVSNISSAITDIETNSIQKSIHKHSVLIVGLMSEQEAQITKEYKEFFDLKFFKDKKLSSLSDLCKNSNTVILMTKFISHNHQDMAKKSGAAVVFCNGGVSELSNILESIYSDL